MKKLLSLFFILSILTSVAQPSWDTTKYLKYTDRLVIAAFTSWRNFDYTFLEKNPDDTTFGIIDSMKSTLHYLANANSVSGLEFNYDKISFSLGVKSAATDLATKGATYIRNFNLSLGGAKWIAEGSYRRYKGFYESNTANYDTNYNASKIYTHNPSLTVEQIKTKFMYFTNHKKFAYKAGYSSTYRQLKSAFSWIFGGNFYMNKMRTDTSFVPAPLRHKYGQDSLLKGLQVTGFSAGLGGSVNIVLLKGIFVNLTFAGYLEPQWRTYDREFGPDNKMSYVSVSGDARGSIGYNGKNFFITINSLSDFVLVNSKTLEITSKFISGSLSIGYRFKVKTPKFYQKFQDTKFYKML